MKKYFYAFSVFVFIAAIILFFVSTNTTSVFQNILWILFAYFSVITLAFHYGVSRATASRPQVFVHYYMGATTAKLLLNLGIIVGFAMLHREMAVHFIIAFMIMYFVFTVFEVIFIWKTIRKKS